MSPDAAEQPPPTRVDARKEIARYLTSLDLDADLAPEPAPALGPGVRAAPRLQIDYPEGLAPTPQPAAAAPDPDAALPQADVVVITWTSAEQRALCDVFTPGFRRESWYRYRHKFDTEYKAQIRKGAPALLANRLGSYFPTQIGPHTVLAMKSELHLNQDGIENPEAPGTSTLPVKQFFEQIIQEAQPKLFLTIGTSGSVYEHFALGDVVVTRAAKFRCHREFRNEPFNDKTYTSDWQVPMAYFDKAEELMQSFKDELVEPPFGPPTKRFAWTGPLVDTSTNLPKIRREGRDMPEFHPILTTDYFEYGTTANRLDQQGAAVEMGDAALGLAVEGMANPPRWLVVRNMSDPLINGDLPATEYKLNQQTTWAVGYYTAYGYWTSVMGALASWAVVAGFDGA